METGLTRRHFLQALASIGTLGFQGGFVTACSSSELLKFQDLEQLLPGRVLLPGSDNYERFTTPWNLMWTGKRPVASSVVRATSAADVSTAIKWARETQTPIVARSGGHSYAGYSTTSGLVIDVSSMTNVAFDKASGEVLVGGGVRNSNVYAELAKVSRTITHGRCYGVGVAGLVLGGGVGFNMRRFGLTCDQLLDTEVVLANGDIVRANAQESPDLFWAARGAGGGNFGIHTSFRFQTHAADPLAVFDLTYTTKIEEALSKVFELAYDAPRELGLKITVRAKRDSSGQTQIVMNLLGQWAGPQSDLEAWLAPLHAIVQPEPNLGFLLMEAYWDGQALLSEEGGREFMYERSRYAKKPFGQDVAALILSKLKSWPSTSVSTSWKGFLTGGIIQEVSPDATAFVHRSDWLLTTIDLNWNISDDSNRVLESLEWLDTFHEAMTVHTSTETYQNFIDESQTDWPRAYHGSNLERLVQVKRKYDPENVFSFHQSIPLEMPKGI